MISGTGYLPKTFLQPINSGLQQPLRSEPPKSQSLPKNNQSERIIEAEWRPVSSSSSSPRMAHQAAPLFSEEGLSSLPRPQPSVVAEHYQGMSPQPQFNRGTIINIQA